MGISNHVNPKDDEVAEHWALVPTLIETCKLNEVDARGLPHRRHHVHRRWTPKYTSHREGSHKWDHCRRSV
jgi:hypothetical protein